MFKRSNIFGSHDILGSWLPTIYISNESVELKTDNNVAKQKETWLVEKLRKFDVAKSPPETIIVYRGKNYVEPEVMPPPNTLSKVKAISFAFLRFYRLKAKKKMISPNLEVRIRYKLEKSFILTYNSKGQAKGNLELRKFDVAKSPPETIIVYHGKNYVEPEVMPPPNTLSKVKALEKYRYEQSLEHTSQFIERLEKGLEEYHQHLAKFKNGKNDIAKDVNLAVRTKR
ncbi:hypothetical protein HKD37_07G019675 [Glycine soja]